MSIAEDNWKAYQRARDAGHDDYVEAAKKQDRFYLGDQWDQRDADKLTAEGRPTLTINLVMKVVNAFLGHQAAQRADIAYKPARDGVATTAHALTRLVGQILDDNKYEWREREMFMDGIVVDRGYLDLRVNFDKSITGDICIEAPDPFEILPDPDSKSDDPNDWNEVTRSRWMTLDQIELHYGKEARKKVEALGASPNETYGSDSLRFEGTRTFGSEEYESSQSFMDDPGTLRSARVIERQHKKLSRVEHFVDPTTGDMSPVPEDMPESRARDIARRTGVYVVAKLSKRIRWTVTADQVVLHDDWSPYRSFTIVPYFPFFRRGKTSGVVKQLMSPQEQFNKLESQMLHVVNTSANSGWAVEAGSLTNMTIAELEERGAETGLVLEYKKESQAPAKIQPNQIPTGLDRLADRAKNSLSDISGVGGLVKTPGAEVLGVALREVEQLGLIQVDVPFDSLKKTRHMVARKLLELVQDFYTETRVLRAIVGNGAEEFEEEIVLNGITAAGEILNDVTLGEYDTVVTTQPSRDTFEDVQFATAIAMREAGIMVPDDEVIRHSPLENKDAVAERVARLMGTAEPTEQEMQLAQLDQDLVIKQRMAEIAKLEATAQELQARAAAAFAKADQTSGQAQIQAVAEGMKWRQAFNELNAKLTMFYSDLENKLQLAGIHSASNERQTAMKEASASFREELKSLTAIRKEQVKPKPASQSR